MAFKLGSRVKQILGATWWTASVSAAQTSDGHYDEPSRPVTHSLIFSPHGLSVYTHK